MGSLSKLINAVCWWIVRTFPGRYRIIGDNGNPYLGRFYIKHTGVLPGLYLHHFYRSDSDRELHNHPWKFSRSIVLVGGYYEERYESATPISEPGYITYHPKDVRMFNRQAPGYNKISNTTFHRVVLKDLKNGAWTLFIPGPEVKDWGFLDRTTGKYTPHATLLGEKFWDVSPSREASQQTSIRPAADRDYLELLQTMEEKGIPVTKTTWNEGVRTGRLDSSKPNYSMPPRADRSHKELQYWLKKGAGVPVEYNEEFENKRKR